MLASSPDALSPQTGIVRRIFGNLALLLGGKAAAGLISLIYMVIAARVLGPEAYGVLVLVNYFAMLVGGIVAFPGWHAIVKYGVSLSAEGKHRPLLRLLRFAGTIELAVGVASVIIAASVGSIFGSRLGWSGEARDMAIPYAFAVLATVRATPGGLLQILGRFDLLGLHNIVTPLMRLIGTFAVISLGLGLHGFLIAWLIAALVEGASLWIAGIYLARKHFPDTPLWDTVQDVRPDHDGLGRFMVTANLDIMLADIAGRITPVIVGTILGPAAAGLYSIAHRTTIVIAQPAQVLGQAAYAELARLVAHGAAQVAVRKAVLRIIAIALASAVPVLVVFAFFSQEIILLIAGSAYSAAATVMVWLAAARVIAMVCPPTSSALIALGRPGLSVTSNLICNLALLPLLPLFNSFWGLPGTGMFALLQSSLAACLLLRFLWRAAPNADLQGLAN